MFDIGFWELIIISLVALFIFGPEKLPQLARDLNYWLKRFRNLSHHLKTEFEHELNISEVTDLQDEIKQVDNLIQKQQHKPAKD